MVLWIALGLLLLKGLADAWLEGRNRRCVQAHADKVPEAFAAWVDGETYRKSVAYTLAKSRFGSAQEWYGMGVLVLVLVSGVLPWLFEGFMGLFGEGSWAEALTLVLVGMVLGLADLPWEWAAQFRLEERFGFNKSTLKLWIADKLKGTLVGLLIGVPVVAAIVGFFKAFPDYGWLWAAMAFLGFQLLMVVLYPMLILPLFNKLSPLPEGVLKDRLLALGERAGFRARRIQVIDGSKRSSHSNAYFTGFGRYRRIVLYDTLIEQLEDEELEAVLAHEIGHYKLGHIPKMLAVVALGLVGSFGVLQVLLYQAWFLEGFGFAPQAGIAGALLLVGLLGGLVTFWLGPLMHRLSRKHEYEADAFAAKLMGDVESLRRSLRKLHAKNLSNLTPDPLYSAFHYSHPTLLERERALDALRGAW